MVKQAYGKSLSRVCRGKLDSGASRKLNTRCPSLFAGRDRVTVINHGPKANTLTECKAVTRVKQETGVPATRPWVERPREGNTSLQRLNQQLLLPVALTKENSVLERGWEQGPEEDEHGAIREPVMMWH